MLVFFRVLSALYISGIFFLADSSVVEEMAAFNPYSLLHIPLYGILTLLLILSFSPKRTRSIYSNSSTNPTNSIDPIDLGNPSNQLIAGIIALVVAVADEIHQAYLPNRNASVIDVLLDIMGIILCMFVIKCMKRTAGFSKIVAFTHRNK